MSVHDVLIAARRIAEEAGVEHADLAGVPPQMQVREIRDRIARKVIATREEMLGLTADRRLQRNAGHSIAA